MWQPRHDEWTKLAYTLQELRHNGAEDEAERVSLAAPTPAPPLAALNPLR
jgi:hypothetical protein